MPQFLAPQYRFLPLEYVNRNLPIQCLFSQVTRVYYKIERTPGWSPTSFFPNDKAASSKAPRAQAYQPRTSSPRPFLRMTTSAFRANDRNEGNNNAVNGRWRGLCKIPSVRMRRVRGIPRAWQSILPAIRHRGGLLPSNDDRTPPTCQNFPFGHSAIVTLVFLRRPPMASPLSSPLFARLSLAALR